jgi:hypothetical protein
VEAVVVEVVVLEAVVLEAVVLEAVVLEAVVVEVVVFARPRAILLDRSSVAQSLDRSLKGRLHSP